MTLNSTSNYFPNKGKIERLFEEHKNSYSDEYLRSQGKIDAENNIPNINSEDPAPFEQELTHSIATLASKIASLYRSKLETIDAEIKSRKLQLNNEHQHEIERINMLYEIDSDAEESSFKLADAHSQLETAEKHFDNFYERHGRGPIFYIPNWLYIILATLIFLGEIPLNALVFQIFGENQVMTWVMAFIIGLSVPLSAHFIGIKLREHEGGVSWANGIKAFAGFAIITAALYGLSIMRKTYLQENMEELGLTMNLVDSSFQFFWLNMAVFCTAIFIAYLSHDTVPGFQEAKKEKQTSRKRVAKFEKNRVKNLVRVGKQKAFAINKANYQFRERMTELYKLKGIYDHVLNEGKASEDRCLQLLNTQASIYRQENSRLRSDDLQPPGFKNKLGFPLKLHDLEEKLDNNDRDSDIKPNSDVETRIS